MKLAQKHAEYCRALKEQGRLDEALAFCRREQIEPPACPLSSTSRGAARERQQAADKLADYGWWEKRLKLRSARRRLRKFLIAAGVEAK